MSKIEILAVLPIYHREEETLACLDAFSRTSLEGINLTVVLAVNGARDTFLDTLKKMTSGDEVGIPKGAQVRLLNLPNPGKGVAVNTAVRLYADKTDFVLSLDSDMVPTSENWLKIFVESFQELIANKIRVGAISSQQVGMCCHVPVSGEFRNYGKFSYTFANGNQGIAGGCLLTPYAVWCELGGYRKSPNVYGGNDGYYMYDLYQSGYIAAIAENCVLFHPPSTDAKYADWKRRATIGKLREDERKGFYE